MTPNAKWLLLLTCGCTIYCCCEGHRVFLKLLLQTKRMWHYSEIHTYLIPQNTFWTSPPPSTELLISPLQSHQSTTVTPVVMGHTLKPLGPSSFTCKFSKANAEQLVASKAKTKKAQHSSAEQNSQYSISHYLALFRSLS